MCDQINIFHKKRSKQPLQSNFQLKLPWAQSSGTTIVLSIKNEGSSHINICNMFITVPRGPYSETSPAVRVLCLHTLIHHLSDHDLALIPVPRIQLIRGCIFPFHHGESLKRLCVGFSVVCHSVTRFDQANHLVRE